MNRVLFLMMPFAGHVHPNIRLIKELSQKNIQTLIYCDKKYFDVMTFENITLRSYPNEILQFCFEMGAPSYNKQETADIYFSFLTDSFLVLQRIEEEAKQGEMLLEKCIEEIMAFKPEIVLYDTQATFTYPLIKYLNCPIVEINCSPYQPSLHNSISFKKYYEKIVKKESSRNITYDGLLSLHRKADRKLKHRETKKKICCAYLSPLLQDEYELIPKDYNYIGFTLDGIRNSKERDGIYVSRGTINNGYSACLMAETLDIFNKSSFSIRASVGNNILIYKKLYNENIHIMEYANQLEELSCAHIFVTHGGITGVREAILCGTPMIVIPTSYMEYQVGCALTKHNAGILVDSRPLNKEDLIHKCYQIINNYDMYQKGIKKIQDDLRERWDNVGLHAIFRKCEELL